METKLHIPQQTIAFKTRPDNGATVKVETVVTVNAGDVTAEDVIALMATTTSPIVRWQSSARRNDDGIPRAVTIDLDKWLHGEGRKVRVVREKPMSLDEMRAKAKVDPAYKELLRKALEE